MSAFKLTVVINGQPIEVESFGPLSNFVAAACAKIGNPAAASRFEARNRDGEHISLDEDAARTVGKGGMFFANLGVAGAPVPHYATIAPAEQPVAGDAVERAAKADLYAALVGMVRIHDEPAGFVGKYGNALDAAISAQQKVIDERLSLARAALSAAGAQPGDAARLDALIEAGWFVARSRLGWCAFHRGGQAVVGTTHETSREAIDAAIASTKEPTP
jgi:hypothetical protein